MPSFKKPVSKGSGEFYKPKDWAHNHEGYMLEVERYRDAETSGLTDYNGVAVAGVDAKLYAFKSDKDNSPLEKDVTFTHKSLVESLRGLEGELTIVKLGQSNAKPGKNPAWIWVDPEPQVEKHIIEWATKREEALAEAAADAPSFDD